MTRRSAGTGVTEAEFLSLPESHDRVELIDGEIILAPSPLRRHQDLLLALARALDPWAAAHPPAYVGLSPLDVRLAPGRIVQPDLFVLLAGPPAGERPLDVVPDLVVEVLSTNRSYDRLTKRLLYAQAGVQEYWIVDPDDASIELVLGLENAGTARDRLRSRTLPGLEIDVEALFGGLP